MPDGQITEHKLIINCPVAENPDIFSQINGSIEVLRVTLESVMETAKTAEKIAIKAKTKVDYLYYFCYTLAGLIGVGSLLYQILVG